MSKSNERNRLRDIPKLMYFSKTEFEIIEDKAKYCGLNLSEYIRQMAVDGLIVKRDFSGVEEINKIGVNINQIAKKCNERGSVLERDLEELRLQYEKLFEIVYGHIISD